MNQAHLKQPRLLAIAPSSRGFGFVVLEGRETLVDWGVKPVKNGDKNRQSLSKAKELITHYQPEVLVLQNMETKQSRRLPRIRALNRWIIALAGRCKIKVALRSDRQVKRVFFADGGGTKDALAEILAKRFPQELGDRLPPKRRPWESEDYRMAIFDATALALAYLYRRQKWQQARV